MERYSAGFEYLLEASLLQTQRSIVHRMERSRGRVYKLKKPGGSFWAGWEEHHGQDLRRCLHVQILIGPLRFT